MNGGDGDGSGIRNAFFSNAGGVDTGRMEKDLGLMGVAARMVGWQRHPSLMVVRTRELA